MKEGMQVIILAGWGGKGGMAGHHFKRFTVDTPAIVTDVVGSTVYVRPVDSPYKWAVQHRALIAQ